MTEIPDLPPFRPPSEAYSLLVRATRNCPWNRCIFCGMYKTERFGIRSVDEIKTDIRYWKDIYDRLKEISWRAGFGGDLRVVADKYGIHWLMNGDLNSVFIGDSDSIVMKTNEIVEIVEFIRQTFPNLQRITSYARTNTVLRKKFSDLERIRKAGLDRLHIGLETGDDEVLKYVQKGVNQREAIEAGIKAKEAGFEVSEYVIIGIGGRDRWKEHAKNTAIALNKIAPNFIRVRTLFPLPNTKLYEDIESGIFMLETPLELLKEEMLLIESLECESNFLSDHISNLVNIEGKLPLDKKNLLFKLENFIEGYRY